MEQPPDVEVDAFSEGHGPCRSGGDYRRRVLRANAADGVASVPLVAPAAVAIAAVAIATVAASTVAAPAVAPAAAVLVGGRSGLQGRRQCVNGRVDHGGP